jgi:phenylacetate-CoA ligase
LLSKDRVRDAGSELMAHNSAKYRPKAYSTSGTSGQPLIFYLDKSANALEFVYYWRYWGWAGYRLGDRFAELGSHFFLERPKLSSKAYHYQGYLRRLHLNSAQVSSSGAGSMAAAIRKHRPLFLKGVSSTLYFFALSLKEAGITDLSFKAVFSTGEVVTELYRRTIQSVFNAPLLDSYGHMERTVSISQCMEGGYHVNSDYGILEITDQTAENDGTAFTGRAVGTSLYNRAMPLIRYDIGDEIETFSDARSCPCGRTLPLIKAIHGRSEDVIITPDGRFITSLFIVPEFVTGIRFAQFAQISENEMEVRVVPGLEWNQNSENQLLQYTRRLLGPTFQLRLDLTSRDGLQRDRSGKIRSVIGLKAD